MEKMNIVRKSLVKDIRGANMVEYCILTGAVALAGMAGFNSFGGSVKAKVNEQAGKVSSIGGSGSP